ncbi:hypothetical protein [Paenibacillus tepidiphilus]|uniref:hypothetical protein n=1 Tax=Paenibacillus tepidiphilus TaxID=2608683 RepID=UPI00123A6849|nr:hypothetical protein [Paenibacillus tepidiphilus]
MKMTTGQTLEIVYQEKATKFTQRIIKIIGAGRIRATCQSTVSPRVFLNSDVLAWQPMVQPKRYA